MASIRGASEPYSAATTTRKLSDAAALGSGSKIIFIYLFNLRASLPPRRPARKRKKRAFVSTKLEVA